MKFEKKMRVHFSSLLHISASFIGSGFVVKIYLEKKKSSQGMKFSRNKVYTNIEERLYLVLYLFI